MLGTPQKDPANQIVQLSSSCARRLSGGDVFDFVRWGEQGQEILRQHRGAFLAKTVRVATS